MQRFTCVHHLFTALLNIDTCTLKLRFTPQRQLLMKLTEILFASTLAIHSHIELLLFDWIFLYTADVVGGHTSHTLNNIISQRPDIVYQL